MRDSDRYKELHALATKARGRLFGAKLRNSFFVRLAKDDNSVVHILSVKRPTYWYQTQGSHYTQGKIKHEDRPVRVIATLKPDGMLLEWVRHYSTDDWFNYPPETLAAYPGLKTRPGHIDKGANNDLNKFLALFGIAHYSNGDADRPGVVYQYRKLEQNIHGPMYYDAKLNAVKPVWEQKNTKVVNEALRLENNRALRTAFKKIKLLNTFGVSVTAEDIDTVCSGKSSDELQREFGDIQEFVKRVASFDPDSHEATVDLVVRAGMINVPSWSRHSSHIKHHGNLLNENVRRQLRRKIHRATGVVRWE
jgi:hypothetical protein